MRDITEKELKIGDLVVAHDGTKSSNLKVCMIVRITEKTVILETINNHSKWRQSRYHRKPHQVVKID